MTRAPHTIDGDLYLDLETVAEIYHVRVVWLRSVYERGLIGEGVGADTTISIAAAQMERVATIVRLHVGLGLDVAAISRFLERDRR